MESRLGQSFSDVRVHEGHQATLLGAVAFTQGTNLYFAPGHYQPHTEAGRQLVAHELVHTVQQPGAGAQQEAKGMVSVPSEPPAPSEPTT
jgi:hypothetical protein